MAKVSGPGVSLGDGITSQIDTCITLPAFFLKALCTRLLSLDSNRSCGIEVQSVEKSNVWTDVAVQLVK